jgi:4-hydroxy-tetrahydrodipicolinate synthase
MKEPIFTGVCTAMVTPFLSNQVNYPMMEQLLRRQLENGVRSALICGTTGESATLKDEEKLELVRRCKEYVGSAMQIIAGTGSNDTAHAIALSRQAQEAGADALLVVSPYYNKATPEGLVDHYTSIANAVDIPVIIYNVPSRTGVDIPVSVYKTLSSLPNIAGVKEASTDIEKVLRTIALCGDALPVWAGNDAMTVPVMALGGKGVISVASNVFPREFAAMTASALTGDFTTAAKLQWSLVDVVELMFCEVNPIPVKAILKQVGFDCGETRLPLTPLSAANQKRIEAYFQ